MITIIRALERQSQKMFDLVNQGIAKYYPHKVSTDNPRFNLGFSIPLTL